MQPRPLFRNTLSTIMSRYRSQSSTQSSPKQDLRKPRAVHLHARISLVALDGGRAAKDQAAPADGHDRRADFGLARDKSKSPRAECPP